jgi:hypothetical protein
MDEGGDGEDVYHHREAYFNGFAGPRDSQIPTVDIIPSSPSPAKTLFTPPSVVSPQSGLGDGPSIGGELAEEDAYDYFGGPDLGEDYGQERSYSGRERLGRTGVDLGGVGFVRYAQGGAASVLRGRHRSDKRSECPASDDSNERRGRDIGSRSDERSRSLSRSRTPSPIFSPTPTHPPAIGHTHVVPSSPPKSSLLTPHTRGRNAIPSEPRARGRSATRGSSSFSDRERSETRGTNSPIGSLSPEGSAIGIGIGSVYAQGRVERKRERMIYDRKPRESLSPEDVVSGRVQRNPPTEGRWHMKDDAVSLRSQSTSSVCSSSTASSSVTVKPAAPQPVVLPTSISISTPVSTSGSGELKETEIQRLQPATSAHSATTIKPPSFPNPLPRVETHSVSTTEAIGMMSRATCGGNGDITLSQNLSLESVGKVAGKLMGAIWHT